MSIDQLMETFISNAVVKIANKDELMKETLNLKHTLPRRRGKYVPIVTGNRSDFEIIQLPKVKFIRDHNDQLISKKGKIIGEYKTLMPAIITGDSQTVGRPDKKLIE